MDKGTAEIRDIPVPRPDPDRDEVLIRVKKAGICSTDFEVIEGMINFSGVLGHEFVGVVENDPSGGLEGKRVVGEINIPCRECSRCQKNQYKHCLNIETLGMRRRDGVFAEFLTLPRSNLHVVPKSITDHEAVFTEPIAAAVEIAEQYHLKPSEPITIIGDGRLGLVTARALWGMGFSIEVIGRHQDKLATLDLPGITAHLEADFPAEKDTDLPVVIEASGSTSGLEKALQLAAPRGKIIYKTTTARSHEINLADLAIDEIQLLGSRCGPFAPALNLLARNDLRLEKLITAEYSLNEAKSALEEAARKSSLKVILKP